MVDRINKSYYLNPGFFILNKHHIVLVGGGFAGISFIKRIDLASYDVTVISPRNHFLFTPLLPETTVGTLEFRSVIEPIRKARQGIRYIQASCTALDPVHKQLVCSSVETDTSFTQPYDTLIIAAGAVNNTFGIPGVAEHACFLKELTDARTIRERIITCLERACIPDIGAEEQQRLLHFVVVGGGPTGVEFAAELHDLLENDLVRSYPDLQGKPRITLFEAGTELLTAFDRELGNYARDHFRRQGIAVRTETPVNEVGDGYLVLSSGERVSAGLIVWSTGYAPTEFVRSLPFAKNKTGRILTDEYLRVNGSDSIFAMGDCALVAGSTLPQTAQAAMQEGKYLAKLFNDRAERSSPKPFAFHNLGMLSYIGGNQALADIPKAGVRSHGVSTYLFWRSAYLTRLVSLKGKVLVLFDWIKAAIFGRDLSKF